MIRQNVMPERSRVLRAEPMAPVIAVAAELRGAALRIEIAGIGAEPKIAAAQRGFGARLRGAAKPISPWSASTPAEGRAPTWRDRPVAEWGNRRFGLSAG